ncbi:MAG: hypothetical protein HYR85_14835 [Planctomycetes bacterium]|nr:hypothetical protein [Planctomycetota bacterium]MBI3845400.1 hypothetical protein [Planctomycetota bacterium]
MRSVAPLREFDFATLHNVIDYFTVKERVSVLRHVRGFLKQGGRVVITTACQGSGTGIDILNLWGTLIQGCGRLPSEAELLDQMKRAGFESVTSRILIPGEPYYGFVGA